MKKSTSIITTLTILLVISIPFTFAAEISLTYDANGNLVTGDGYYREYNNLNQLYKIYNGSTNTLLLEEYTYHPIEERVWLKKTYNNSGILIETVYYWNQNFQTIVNLSGEYNITYVYLDGQLVAQNVNNVKTFYATDHKGTIVATMNSSGSVLEQNQYSPTGKILANATKSRYGYEGKEYSGVSRQTDYNFRMYSQDNYIFSTPDTIIQNVYDAQSLNRYSFERNSPYNNVDPTGHIFCDLDEGCFDINIGGYHLILGNAEYDESDMIEGETTQVVTSKEFSTRNQWKADIFVAAGTYGTARGTSSGTSIVKNSASEKVAEQSSNNIVRTSKGDFTLSNEASKRMVDRGITKADITKTIDKSDPINYYKGGSSCTGYYCSSTKVFVPTNPKTKNIITVFKSRYKYIEKFIKGDKK